MVKGGWERIVTVSSRIVSQLGSLVGGNVLRRNQGRLEAHMLNLAAEIDGSGVTVNVYRPGSVDTALQGFIRAQNPEAIGGGAVERFRTHAEKGSVIVPEHSASALVTLLEADGNGEVWHVAGDPH
jgi:NAD(P)-dependent dehydrogenase (short-subunit alcohol dehydrogenase family)